MSKSTRATKALEQAGVAFTVHAYDYDPDADKIGLQAAAALGEPPQRVLKTLSRWSMASRSASSWPPTAKCR